MKKNDHKPTRNIKAPAPAGKLQPMVLPADTISILFTGTNFGSSEKTDVGRRGLMVECVLKRASGYHDGHTITTICKEAGLLTEAGRPTKAGMRWAFDQLYRCGGGPTMLERMQNPSLQGTGHLVDHTLQGVVGRPESKEE
jgi:hypothetical protein